MNKKEFIEDLCKKRSDYKDPDQAETAANLLDTVSSDIYSESERFVFELIQNADDSAIATSNEVRFDFFQDHLVVSHTGKPFDESDISSLTKAGSSTKQNDLNKTGYKGIGFKSVFGKSSNVAIFSDGYQFRFDKTAFKEKLPWQIIPIWTDVSELTKEVQNIITTTNASVSTVLNITKVDALLKDLLALLSNGQILLFLRRISKISVTHNGKQILTIEKRILNQEPSFNHVSLIKDGKAHSTWLVKVFENIPISEATKTALQQDDKTPPKLKGAVQTEIAFAAKIEEGKIKSLTPDESLVFTYLPTKFGGFKFPFLVNGSFLTTAGREDLHEDRAWNQWLMTLVAEKIIEWLILFSGSKHEFQILSLVPDKFNQDSNALKREFDKALNKVVTEKAFIPSIGKTLKKPSELIIDRTGLSELSFITPDTVIEFINKKDSSKFMKDAFIHPQIRRLDKLRQFNVKTFDAENLDTFFQSPIFLSKHEPKDNFALIDYFFQMCNKEDTKHWADRLKETSFIYAETNILRSPQAVCFPSIAYKNDMGAGVTVIHPEVYQKIETNSKVKRWLETMGVKEPSDTAYLENEIIGNIDTCITEENYLKITTYLFNQHKKGVLTELHYSQLQTMKLFTTTRELAPANLCFLSDAYEPSMKLEKVNSVCKYISEAYKQAGDLVSEWKTFFLKIGSNENIELHQVRYSKVDAREHYKMFIDFFDRNPIQRYRANNGKLWDNPIETYTLTTYSLFEFATKYDFAKVFWEKATESPFNRTENDRGKAWLQNKHELDENFFEWCLNNAEIFPSTQRKCARASELFINDKEIIDIAGSDLSVFDHPKPLTDSWKKMIPFKEKLELEDYLTVLEKIAEENEDGKAAVRSDIRRIGLIYNKLASLLPNFSEDKKEAIKNWAKRHKLYSGNGKFEPANELKWITIEGFSTVSEKLKTIQLPDNCDKNSADFIELIYLFQVQTINEFTPQFEEDKIETSLKAKLQEILPFYVAIIEKKKMESRNKEFNRIYAILNVTTFYTASDIRLSFINEGEVVPGPSLTVYKGDYTFHFKGKWKSERTLLSLIEGLSNMLDVKGLDSELRFLLLESDNQEIREWLIEKGIDLASIHPGRAFVAQARMSDETPADHAVEIGTPQPGEAVQVESTPVTTAEEVTAAEEEKEPEVFAPKTQVEDVDVTRVPFTTKTYTSSPTITERTYAPVQNQKVREDIGLWSEKLVNKKLLENTELYSKVTWVNEHGESGKPYDFHLVLANGREKYADVKGTPSATKNVINLSTAEWLFMLEKGENYSIFRVYNAGEDHNDARIVEIENPSSLLQQGKILPNPITLQI